MNNRSNFINIILFLLFLSNVNLLANGYIVATHGLKCNDKSTIWTNEEKDFFKLSFLNNNITNYKFVTPTETYEVKNGCKYRHKNIILRVQEHHELANFLFLVKSTYKIAKINSEYHIYMSSINTYNNDVDNFSKKIIKFSYTNFIYTAKIHMRRQSYYSNSGARPIIYLVATINYTDKTSETYLMKAKPLLK